MTKTYDTYKDSGIAWIGEIPSEWKISRYKFYTSNRMGETILSSDTVDVGVPIYSATQDNSIFGYIANPKVLLKKGDIVIPARGNSIGCATLIKDEIATCTQTTICSTDMHDICTKFLYHCIYGLRDEWFKFDGSAIPQVTVDQIKNNILPLPSIEEQDSIATFLDQKCQEIDSLISLQEEMISELQAFKQSVITEAVTKGLDKNVKMKDSGVEWIGEIPEGWEVMRFKTICQVKANLVHPDDYLDMPQIAPDCIEKGSGKIVKYQSVKEANVISDNHLFYKGQIVYSKIRPTLNKVTIAPFDGLCSADMYPIETSEDLRYSLYQMLSSVFNEQVAIVVQDRVKMPKINKEELDQVLMIVPPILIQRQIATYLDTKTSQIDSLISLKQEKIAELKDYKKSVIYEYVTGKKRV